MVVPVCPLSIDRGVDTVITQNADEEAHIRKVGHIFERDRVGRQQACDHKRQSCVLGAADRNRATKLLPAGYPNSIHGVRRSEVLCRPVFKAFAFSSCKRALTASQASARLT